MRFACVLLRCPGTVYSRNGPMKSCIPTEPTRIDTIN
jgi:hypothetical protein